MRFPAVRAPGVLGASSKRAAASLAAGRREAKGKVEDDERT
jgi:hypothetical protein